MSNYGTLPRDLGHYPIECKEGMFYLYMPIKMPGQNECTIPERLARFSDLIGAVAIAAQRWTDRYVYITAKHMYVAPGVPANRPGWHSDGFLTDDENFLWSDALPTVFNNSSFEVEPDHVRSRDQFWPQALPENDVRYPNSTLLALDQYVIHRVDEPTEGMFRTFVKISVSSERYNLSGNTHNYELDYDWPMHERLAIRNTPHTAQMDAI